ncbi:MAG: polysaccharide pyruvyl transferase family protein [Clostridia bacterium]|nr:polysaccharide pyruvyl transferase family protein [Clostridia bacterium]
MLRVCGITFVRTTNYGTCFQAYALQKAIDGITVGNGVKCQCEFVPLWRCKDHFSNKQSTFFYSHFFRFFKRFQEDGIRYADCKSIRELPSLNQEYDAFVCGSDVIWNPVFNRRLGLYYLDFANKYKFSYAPSFGKANIEDPFLNEAGRWISELAEISVREPSAVEIVKEYAGREAQVVTDPVLLLAPDEWKRITEIRRDTGRYIFSYTTHSTSEYEQFLRKLSKQTGLKVIRAVWVRGTKAALKQKRIMIQSPEKWLSQLCGAEYVVTNSFHATVFSSMLHKKFFTVVHGEKDEGSNIRMYDYLKATGLQDRMYCSIPETIDLSDVDFSGSDDSIHEMREKGLAFLRENLEAAWKEKNREKTP